MSTAALLRQHFDREIDDADHGKSGWSIRLARVTSEAMREGPRREGLAKRAGGPEILDLLLIPRDARGIVLLCGFVAAVMFGLLALLSPPGDPIGWAYIAVGVLGYFYIQTRFFPTFVWLLVAAGGVAVASGGNPSGWVETGLGVALAVVALLPVPEQYRDHPTKRAAIALVAGPPPRVVEANGGQANLAVSDQSTKVEDPPVLSASAASDNGSEATPSSRPRIAINALGHLRIQVDGRDITGRLSEPRLEFLFSYLLARHVRGIEVAVERGALAEEVAPGIGPTSGRDRLRKQLYDLQSADSLFEQLLRSNRSKVLLDLEDVDLDVARLLERGRKIRSRDFLIDTELAEQVRQQLDETKGEFLAGFSELEHQVTAGRGTAEQVVEEARARVAGVRADLALSLAQHDIAVGRPARAIPYLNDALLGSSTRQDLARVLIDALLQTGQTAAATQLRREYDIEER